MGSWVRVLRRSLPVDYKPHGESGVEEEWKGINLPRRKNPQN